MVDFSKLPPIAQVILADAQHELILNLEAMSVEELVSYAENEQGLNEYSADLVRIALAEKLAERCPGVFGVNAMKKFFAEAETAEEGRAHTERLVANAATTCERRGH